MIYKTIGYAPRDDWILVIKQVIHIYRVSKIRRCIHKWKIPKIHLKGVKS